MTTRTQRGRSRSDERGFFGHYRDRDDERWPESRYQNLRREHDGEDYDRNSRYDDQEDDDAYYDRLRSRQSQYTENDADDGTYNTRRQYNLRSDAEYSRNEYDYNRHNEYDNKDYDRRNFPRNDYDYNRERGQRGQSWNQGYQGGYGNGYGQQERRSRVQHGGYFGGYSDRDYERGGERDYGNYGHRGYYNPDQYASHNDRYGYSDSDTRTSGRSRTSRRGFASMPRSEVRRIGAMGGRASHSSTSGRSGTRSRSSRNRSRSSANRGRR
jgi:hypothetical protein